MHTPTLPSIAICQNIAEKLRSYDHISQPDISLAYGLPGFACFYGVMDQCFPDQGWDQVAHSYLKQSVSLTEQYGINSHSLFLGLSGLCFAAYICSRQEKRYQQLLSKLDTLLVKNVTENFLFQAIVHLDKDLDMSPTLCNMMEGISGTLGYLVMRKDHPELYSLATDCIHRLIQLMKRPRFIGKKKVPGWHISQQFQLSEDQKNQFPQGSFLLSMPYGMLGCLSILSISALEGIALAGLHETITEMAYWLKNQQNNYLEIISWPQIISGNESDEPQRNSRDDWCCGIPAVARSLYLASQAIKDRALADFAEDTFLKLFSKPEKEWNWMTTNFAWGRAGLLTITYRMAQETRHPHLLKEVERQKEDLQRYYSASHSFGFQTVNSRSAEPEWIDSPGLFDGATGIALALLLSESRHEQQWDRAFLVR